MSPMFIFLFPASKSLKKVSKAKKGWAETSNMLLSSINWCEQANCELSLQEKNVSDQFVFSWFPSRRKRIHFKQQYC